MSYNSSSRQRRTLYSSTCVETPLFLKIDLDNITEVDEGSQPFLSLVNFVKEGNHLNAKATQRACSLLQKIAPLRSRRGDTNRILFKLAPIGYRSCSGFTKAMIPLLTSSNEELVKAALSFLKDVVNLRRCVQTCRTRSPAVRKIGKQILLKLCEEGVSDELDIHMRFKRIVMIILPLSSIRSLISQPVIELAVASVQHGDYTYPDE
ncbi:hypothetical protein BLNAU_17284 [Blattamonas nauphoetae]|uniref:CLASP N-terminal domain-containing protein n=1 Tax=Blattamonas nauphoetae TaxID=2049346 RepID=A0ABQ9X8Y7_9EUKA|nr:hypothetical protein BLNAU_17284 [Blattamonas nauphoetae]